MKFLGNCKIYTADDECPDCMQCDRMPECTGGIIENGYGEHKKDPNFHCGSEWGWNDYQRTEYDKE